MKPSLDSVILKYNLNIPLGGNKTGVIFSLIFNDELKISLKTKLEILIVNNLIRNIDHIQNNIIHLILSSKSLKHKHLPLVKRLMGLDPTLIEERNIINQTPLDALLIHNKKQIKILNYLIKITQNLSKTQIKNAIKLNNPQTNSLIINHKDSQKYFPLLSAMIKNPIKKIEIIPSLEKYLRYKTLQDFLNEEINIKSSKLKIDIYKKIKEQYQNKCINLDFLLVLLFIKNKYKNNFSDIIDLFTNEASYQKIYNLIKISSFKTLSVKQSREKNKIFNEIFSIYSQKNFKTLIQKSNISEFKESNPSYTYLWSHYNFIIKHKLQEIRYSNINTLKKLETQMATIVSFHQQHNMKIDYPSAINKLDKTIIYKTFEIQVPNNSLTLVKWGQQLNNCLKDINASSHLHNGKSIILAIYTTKKIKFLIEIKNKKITQFKGYKNQEVPEEISEPIMLELKKLNIIN